MGDWFKNLTVPQAVVVCVAIIGLVVILLPWEVWT